MIKIKAGHESSQYAVGTNGGGSQLVVAITLLMGANPDWGVIAFDISNVLNKIKRYSILEELCENIELRHVWYYNFLTSSV